VQGSEEKSKKQKPKAMRLIAPRWQMGVECPKEREILNPRTRNQ
jgi:hypothetical protein